MLHSAVKLHIERGGVQGKGRVPVPLFGPPLIVWMTRSLQHHPHGGIHLLWLEPCPSPSTTQSPTATRLFYFHTPHNTGEGATVVLQHHSTWLYPTFWPFGRGREPARSVLSEGTWRSLIAEPLVWICIKEGGVSCFPSAPEFYVKGQPK